MSTEDATNLIGRTVHLTRGQRYHGAVKVTGIAADHGDRGLHLRAQAPSDHPAITGPWLPECTIPVLHADIHDTEAAARQAIRDRKADAKAARAAGPRMMAATDGNMLAMLVGATRVRSR
jgi:hypothetical protein